MSSDLVGMMAQQRVTAYDELRRTLASVAMSMDARAGINVFEMWRLMFSA
jgi:hypothetical protein